MEDNIFQELKDLLQSFNEFLSSDTVTAIAAAIQAIASFVPQVTELIDKLIELMNDLKTEIANFDVSNIPGLDTATEFIGQVKSFLTSARTLLPDQAGTIDDVLGVADVVGGLSGLDEIKQEILDSLDALIAKLGQLKPA
jgi:hypothetical protein